MELLGKIEVNKMKKVLAVVVTYNRKELLKESIESLLGQSQSGLEILVVDNASTDGTNEYIQEYITKDQIIYTNTGANIGGAGGFQHGVKYGAEEGYEYLWLMDDDTIPHQNALEEFMKADHILQGDYGFLCSDVSWIDGSPCIMNIPTISEEWYNTVERVEANLIGVASCSFVSCFFKVSDVYRVGLPIKEFFIWGDDVEYTRRLTRDKRSYLVYNSKVVHKMASNGGTNIATESPDRLFRYGYSYRNHFYNTRGEKKLVRLTFHYSVLLDFKNILKSKQGGKCKKIKIMIGSYLSGLWFKPEVEYPKVR